LLGTFVEVATSGTNAANLERGINAAFAAVEKVHWLMSFHDPDSDVSRMNREAFPKSLIVHPWTWEVLETAPLGDRSWAPSGGGACAGVAED